MIRRQYNMFIEITFLLPSFNFFRHTSGIQLWTAIADAIKTRQQQQQQQHLQQQQQHLQQQQQQQQQHQHLQQQQHQPPVFSPYQQQQSSQQQPPQLQMPFTGQQQFAGQQQYHSASNPGNYNGMPHAMAQQPPQQHNIQMQHASAPMMPNHGSYQQSSQAPNPTVAPGFQMYHNQHYGGQNFHNMSQNANGNGSIGFMNNAGSSYPNGGVVNGYINPAAQPPPAVPHAPPMSGANQQGASSLPAFPPMQHLNPPPSMSVPQPMQADSSGAAPTAPAAKQTKPRQPRKSKAEKEKEAAAKAAGTAMATPASESDALAAGEGATAAMAVDESSAVDVSPPAPTIPPEDDDGTERPIYSDREFNLTDGRVVQASEFDADRIMSEEDIARQLARRQLSERIYDESVAPSEPTRLHLVNMFDVECVLQKVNQRLGSHMTMSDGARRLLSAAIQQHLCTTVESSIVGARSRYQFSASRHYSSLKDHFAQGESVTTEQLGDFAFRFGPDVRTVLVNEHKKAEYLVQKFNESDRFKLIEDMKDHMSRVAFSGGKRRAENLDMSWKQAEVRFFAESPAGRVLTLLYVQMCCFFIW
jgi:hypothetical protein